MLFHFQCEITFFSYERQKVHIYLVEIRPMNENRYSKKSTAVKFVYAFTICIILMRSDKVISLVFCIELPIISIWVYDRL